MVRSQSCTFNRKGKCAISVSLSLCDKCLAYHPKEKDIEAMNERLNTKNLDNY